MPDSDELSHLLAATGRGDRAAFARLYHICAPHLYGLLLRMLRQREWAEEALQDCFIRVWQRADSYEPARGEPLAWLSTVARYRALDLLRMRRPEGEMPADSDQDSGSAGLATPESEDPLALVTTGEGVDRLGECLKRLPREQRLAVLMAYYHGYTHGELAQALQAPLGTVKSWVRRGLQHLRECMKT